MSALFDGYEPTDRLGKRFRIKSDDEMLAFLRRFVSLTETESTPYKRKPGSYPKKAHYINGEKVNEQAYSYVKKRLCGKKTAKRSR